MGDVIISILIGLAVYGASWALSVTIIGLIATCFGLEFSVPVATGIWLALILAKSSFNRSSGK